MRRRRTVAAAVLLLVICSTVPSFGIERQRIDPGDGPIDRIVHFVRSITKPIARVFDELTQPKP